MAPELNGDDWLNCKVGGTIGDALFVAANVGGVSLSNLGMHDKDWLSLVGVTGDSDADLSLCDLLRMVGDDVGRCSVGGDKFGDWSIVDRNDMDWSDSVIVDKTALDNDEFES